MLFSLAKRSIDVLSPNIRSFHPPAEYFGRCFRFRFVLVKHILLPHGDVVPHAVSGVVLRAMTCKQYHENVPTCSREKSGGREKEGTA